MRKDGTRFWAHAVIDPVRAPDGTLVGYAKIIRDLTERRAAEAVLKRSEEQFRLLVQSVTDYAIYMLDENGNISNWNAGAQRIKGYRPEEIIGQNFSRFYTEEDRAAGLPQHALETAAREGRFEKEGIRVRKDGTTFAAHVVIDAIRDQSGALIGFAKVTRDISERRNAQRELDKAREALFQSQKMDAVGQLTGGVAHDFNNLLMAILGSLELLRKRLPAEPQMLRLLDNAMQGAQRGAVLTQRMLSFARRQALEPKAIDLPQLVRNMVELLQSSVGAGISIETRFPLALSEVLADVNQLELALLNLVVNARDAMPGGGTVEIAAAEENIGAGHATGLSPGRYVCLSVKDHGEGMDDEVLTRAADPFFTTKGVGKGTGLGLSMVQGMAAQIGGRFMLKSGKGEGTTATIWIPVAQEEAGTAKQPTATAQEQTTMCALTVLAVDDDHLVLFQHRGHAGRSRTHRVRSAFRRGGAADSGKPQDRSRHHRSGDAANVRPAACGSGEGQMAGRAGGAGDRLCRASPRRGQIAAEDRQAVQRGGPRLCHRQAVLRVRSSDHDCHSRRP